MSRVRLVPVIFIAILSLSLLFGVFQLYQRFNLVNPLKSDLETLKYVKSVDVVPGNPAVVKVELNNQVTDLQSSYGQIASKVTSVAGGGQIILLDNRDDMLQNLYENITMRLLEGSAKGNYTEMIAAATNLASKAGVQAKITMDNHNYYIQLSKGGRYLYQVMPYTLRQGGASS
jgi:hypothetical protein